MGPNLQDAVRRIHRIYKALGCNDRPSDTLFLQILLDGRFVDDLISIVYDHPIVMKYFQKCWSVFIEVLYERTEIFNQVMDKVVKSLDARVAVDVRPESLADVRVGRVLIHMLQRYPGCFAFRIGETTCGDDIEVLDVLLEKNLTGPWCSSRMQPWTPRTETAMTAMTAMTARTVRAARAERTARTARP
jgi:hypothetical protein